MSTDRSHLHKCARCSETIKLPYGSNVNSWCLTCKATTWHELQTSLDIAEGIEARVATFLTRIQHRVAPEDRPPPPPTLEEVMPRLRAAHYPRRNIENLPETRGKALETSDLLFKNRKSDAHRILWGPNGTGKTQIATRLAALRLLSGKSAGLYVAADTLLKAMKCALDRKDPVEQIMRPLRSTKFLVIDEAQEIGSGSKGAEWIAEMIREIVCERYNNYLPVVWLMNCETRAGVDAILGGRLVSRANETGGFVHCNWPSYR